MLFQTMKLDLKQNVSEISILLIFCKHHIIFFSLDTIMFELLSDNSEGFKGSTQEHLDVSKRFNALFLLLLYIVII